MSNKNTQIGEDIKFQGKPRFFNKNLANQGPTPAAKEGEKQPEPVAVAAVNAQPFYPKAPA